jgi:hypothetical protein
MLLYISATLTRTRRDKMTKNQFKKKYRELVKNVSVELIQRGEAALKSGAIEISDFGDDYALPKIVITAALNTATYSYRPHHPEHKDMVKNLNNYI